MTVAGTSRWAAPPPSGAHSATSSGSAGSAEPAAASPPPASADHVEIGAGSARDGPLSVKKKRRGARLIASDTSGRGLRQYSMKVCEKVESKGRTTYNEVADELVAEFAEPSSTSAAAVEDEEKNIRRRIYDALNVLTAMDIISKDKKEIQWKGLPRNSENDIEDLKAERNRLINMIQKKAPYLQELENQWLRLLQWLRRLHVNYKVIIFKAQLLDLQNLKQRNKQLYGSEYAPAGVDLPFILVQTRPQATVEVEISEDMQLVHFDFNSTPFELHDDSYVLKAMRYYGSEEKEDGEEPCSNGRSSPARTYQHGIPQLMKLNAINSTLDRPLPGILKAPHSKRSHLG